MRRIHFHLLPSWGTSFLGLSLLFLSSCAFKNMIIEHFDKVALYQIDSYLDLSSEQKREIEGPLREAIGWVKAEKLKEVEALLQDLEKAAAARQVPESLIDDVIRKTAVWRQEISAQVAQPATKLLQSLDEGQIKHLEKKLKKSNRKLLDLLAEDPEDFSEELSDYAEDQLKRFKPWYGRLTPEQTALYMRTLRLDRAAIEKQLAVRKASQEAWLEVLRAHNEERTLRAIERWGASIEDESLAPELREFKLDSRKRWREFWIALHKTLSEEQWEQFEGRLEETGQDVKRFLQKQAA